MNVNEACLQNVDTGTDESLWLIRDRTCKIPIYYSDFTISWVVFGLLNAKNILDFILIKKEKLMKGVFHYHLHSTRSLSYDYFKGIKKILEALLINFVSNLIEHSNIGMF